MRVSWGRHVFGLAAVAFGIITLVWHDFNTWQQIRPLGNVPHREILAYLAAAIEIFGGMAIQGRRTARAGAIALGAIYFIFALLWVPHIIAEPLVYDRWGNFFEQFSLVAGAMIVYAMFGQRNSERAREGGSDWLHLLWNLCCLLYARATFLSFWNGGFRSKVDSSGTNVLGDCDHDCVCPSGHRIAFRTFCPASISITHRHDRRLRVADMAAGGLCRSA